MSPRSERPTGEAPDDDRLVPADSDLAADPASADLIPPTLEEAAARYRRGFGGHAWRWARPAFAASAVGLVAVAILVASLVFRAPPAPPAPSSEGFPATVDGLTVATVSQALGAEAAGNPPDDSLVAIEGWINPMPMPAGCKPETPGPALEESCTARTLLLTETRQELESSTTTAGGITVNPTLAAPYLFAREMVETSIDSLLPDMADPSADYSSLQAVLVGHFHDARAAQCSSDQLAACEPAFVVDQLAWLDGKTLGPTVSIGGDFATGELLQPRLSTDAVIAALRPSLDPTDMVVSMTATSLCGIATITGGSGPGGNCADTLWYVWVVGAAPHFPPMAWGAGDSGWMVLDDATGRILGAGGWGFVSVAGGSLKPSSPPEANGLYWLSTDNWVVPGACAGGGLDAVIYGSPTDPHVAWIENSFSSPPRMEIVWPAGYRARFDPNLEILDANGNVVMREGDTVTGDCGGGDGFVFWPSR